MKARLIITCVMASGLLLACGDGGAPGNPPDVREERPPPSSQQSPGSAERPPANAQDPPQNAQRPPQNAQDPGFKMISIPAGSPPAGTRGDGGDNGQ